MGAGQEIRLRPGEKRRTCPGAARQGRCRLLQAWQPARPLNVGHSAGYRPRYRE